MENEYDLFWATATIPDGITLEQYGSLLKAQDAAKKAKDRNWESILNLVFKYGNQAVDLLTRANVIKSKAGLYSGNYDAAGFDALLAANGGDITDPKTAKTPTGSNVLTPLVIGLVAVIAYLVFSQKRK